MPAIPQYQQRTSATNGELGPGPTNGPNGLDLLASALDATNVVLEKADAATAAESLSKLRLATEQKYLEAQQSAAEGAEDFTPTVLKQYDSDLSEAMRAIRTPRVREVFHQHAADMRDSLGSRALNWEANQRSIANLSKTQRAIDETAAALELNPDSFQEAMVAQDRAIAAQQLEPAERQRLRDYLATNAFEAAARGVANKDPRLALANLGKEKSGDPRFDSLTPEARHRVEQFTKQKLVDVVADGVVAKYRTDARQGSRAFSDLAKADLPSDVKSAALSQVRQGLGMLHAERREQYNDQVTEFERSITQGKPPLNSESIAAGLYRKGVYTPEQYTNILQAVDQARMEGARRGADLVSVDEAIRLGQRLDPKDEKIVKAMDLWFKNTIETNGIKPGSDEFINTASALAARTNILPPEAMSWARKSILSGDPALAVPAANAMSRFADAAPHAYAYFDDPNIKAFSSQVDGMVRAGVAPGRAVEIARANTFDVPKARQDDLQAAYRKGKYFDENGGKLQSFLNSDDAFETTFFGKAPEASRAMQDEYGALVRTYFDHTNGDIDQARALAWKDIRGTYGISRVNGEPEVMKYAPELVFPGIDPEVIRADVEKSAADAGIKGAVRLTPSRETGDTRGLVWNLTTTDADGTVEIALDAQNRPLRYAIPTDTQKYLQAQEARKAKAVSEAVAERERRRFSGEVFMMRDPTEEMQ